MKGFVLTFKNNRTTFRLPDLGLHRQRISSFFRQNGMIAAFAVLMLFGMILGVAFAQSFDRTTYDKLDLLFVTNIGARAHMSRPMLFLSCFVSYFLFCFGAFLCALSAWGVAVLPLLSAGYGFTVGLSSAFVFFLYHMSGIGFYILVVFPGTVLFILTLLRYTAACFRLSRRYMRLSLPGFDGEQDLQSHLKRFLKRSLATLLSVIACSVVDMVLWMLFADKFQL